MTAERTKDLENVLTMDADAMYRWMIAPERLHRDARNDLVEVRDEAVRQAEARVRAEYEARINHSAPDLIVDAANALYTRNALNLAIKWAASLSSAPLSSSPVARAEVTEEVIAREWDASLGAVGYIPYQNLIGEGARKQIIAFARRIASLSSAPQDAAAVREKEREAFRAGFNAGYDWSQGGRDCSTLLREKYPTLPAPVAERPIEAVMCDVCDATVPQTQPGVRITRHNIEDCVRTVRETVQALASHRRAER